MQYTDTSLAVFLVFSAVAGIGLTWALPGLITFAILKHPMEAGSISSCVQFVQFVLIATAIEVGAVVIQSLGMNKVIIDRSRKWGCVFWSSCFDCNQYNTTWNFNYSWIQEQ